MHFYHACQGKSVGSYQVGAYNLISMSKIRSLGLQCKISSICVKIQLPFLANILYFALVSKFRTFLLGGVQKRNTIGATPMLGPSHGSKEQQPLDTQGLGHKNRSKELFIHNTTFIWVRVWLKKEKKKERKRRNWWCCSVFFLQLMGTLWKMKLLYVRGPPIWIQRRGVLTLNLTLQWKNNYHWDEDDEEVYLKVESILKILHSFPMFMLTTTLQKKKEPFLN